MKLPIQNSRIRLFLTLVILFCGVVSTADAQVRAKKTEYPEPEILILDTKDKVKLKCTYFAPPKSGDAKDAGKTVIPFILLHDWEGDRTDLLEFAKYLQQQGHAAIVPDLRGHGESVEVIGFDKKLDYKKFRRGEIASVQIDIERCKKYLVQRNNDGELNIDMLVVCAIGKTCPLATQWTINDWYAFPALNSDGIKQGQDVKALILVAPRKKMQTISLSDQVKHPLLTGARGAELPTMIVWSTEDKEAAKDSEYLYERLKKARPDLTEIENKEERSKRKTLYAAPVKNRSLSGKALMKEEKVRGLWAFVNKFVVNKVAQNGANTPWKSRVKKK